MDIIFQGKHSVDDAADSVASILHLFGERYGIEYFADLSISLKLIDGHGDEVELVDAETSEVFTVFEIQQARSPETGLRLVVDNTKIRRR